MVKNAKTNVNLMSTFPSDAESRREQLKQLAHDVSQTNEYADKHPAGKRLRDDF